MTIRENIGRNTSRKKGGGRIMRTMRRRKSLRSGKNSLMFGEDCWIYFTHTWDLFFLRVFLFY
jgi:hypothetical protein